MKRARKSIGGLEKLAILKRYLVEKVPISDLCDPYGLQPSQVYYWQAQLFEHGASVKAKRPRPPARPADRAKPEWRPRPASAIRSAPSIYIPLRFRIASTQHTRCSGGTVNR